MELEIKLFFKDQIGRFLKVLDLNGISPNLRGGLVEFTLYIYICVCVCVCVCLANDHIYTHVLLDT